jgi:hypothetical protein
MNTIPTNPVYFLRNHIQYNSMLKQLSQTTAKLAQIIPCVKFYSQDSHSNRLVKTESLSCQLEEREVGLKRVEIPQQASSNPVLSDLLIQAKRNEIALFLPKSEGRGTFALLADELELFHHLVFDCTLLKSRLIAFSCLVERRQAWMEKQFSIEMKNPIAQSPLFSEERMLISGVQENLIKKICRSYKLRELWDEFVTSSLHPQREPAARIISWGIYNQLLIGQEKHSKVVEQFAYDASISYPDLINLIQDFALFIWHKKKGLYKTDQVINHVLLKKYLHPKEIINYIEREKAWEFNAMWDVLRKSLRAVPKTKSCVACFAPSYWPFVVHQVEKTNEKPS